MDLILREGDKMVSDVYGKNRNQLMQVIVEQCSDPIAILRAGVKMISKHMKKASVKRNEESSQRLNLLKRVAERGDAAGLARILASDNKRKKKTIINRGPLSNKQAKQSKKPTPKRKKPACKPTKPTKPTKKPARKQPRKPAPKRVRRCASS